MEDKYKPVHDPISRAAPTANDMKIDATLRAYMDDHIKLETMTEMNRRNEILAEVKTLFLRWVQFVAVEVLHIPEEEALEAGGELFISGSHKLGVREPDADIDTVCVAPHFCTREHFFSSLKDILLSHVDVKALNAIETAAIPLISFEFRGVSIDLLFAQLAQNAVPRDLDILDDTILRGVDDATEKSLNGPRVTNMLIRLLGQQAFETFLVVLRCVRKWAKARGIYGNKFGEYLLCLYVVLLSLVLTYCINDRIPWRSQLQHSRGIYLPTIPHSYSCITAVKVFCGIQYSRLGEDFSTVK
jgi:poly(A) polymerase